MTEMLDAALGYFREGWLPLPVRFRGKKPILTEWSQYRPDENEVRLQFGNGHSVNMGILLGEPSGGLVDIDLDWPEAEELAYEFLPDTNRVFGRTSCPASHHWYCCTPPLATKRYQDPTAKAKDDAKAMIVEIRSTGAQTVTPPSTHTSGELIRWCKTGELGQVTPDEIRGCVSRLAACALVARHWPAEGARHDTSLALSGLLLRAGWSQDDTSHFLTRAAMAAEDEEWGDRAKDVETTVQRLKTGEKATGGPTLEELLGEKVVAGIVDWLQIRRDTQPTSVATPQWGELQPLPTGDVEVPPLLADILPRAFAPWIQDIADRTQVPLEFVAVPALVAVGAVVGRTIGIFPKRHDDWLVIPNLWGAVVARPGLLKSPAQAEGLRPLNSLAAAAAERENEGAAERAGKAEEIQARRKVLKRGLENAINLLSAGRAVIFSGFCKATRPAGISNVAA